MRYYRASPKDAQSELRTKVSDSVYTRLAELAEERGITLYQITRELLLSALAKQEPPHGGHPKSEPSGADFGKVRGAKVADHTPPAPSPCACEGEPIRAPETPGA